MTSATANRATIALNGPVVSSHEGLTNCRHMHLQSWSMLTWNRRRFLPVSEVAIGRSAAAYQLSGSQLALGPRALWVKPELVSRGHVPLAATETDAAVADYRTRVSRAASENSLRQEPSQRPVMIEGSMTRRIGGTVLDSSPENLRQKEFNNRDAEVRRRADRRSVGWLCRRGGRRFRACCPAGDGHRGDGGSGCGRVVRRAVCGRRGRAGQLERPSG